MPRLSKDQWESVRAEREAGSSFYDIAKHYDISYQAIQKRAKNEGWDDGQDVSEAIRRKVAEKVAGFVVPSNPVKKAEAIDAAAQRAAEVIERHREEWSDVRAISKQARTAHQAAKTIDEKRLTFEDMKAAKITAETFKIMQDAERKAWNLDDPILPDFSKMSELELKALLAK